MDIISLENIKFLIRMYLGKYLCNEIKEHQELLQNLSKEIEIEKDVQRKQQLVDTYELFVKKDIKEELNKTINYINIYMKKHDPEWIDISDISFCEKEKQNI